MDTKLVRLARNLNAKLFTNDYNLAKVAELQKVSYVNLHEVANALKVILLPGEILHLKIVREGKDKGQGVGYLPDGTMVVVTGGQAHVGQQVEVQVQSLLQTGAGIIVFAEVKLENSSDTTMRKRSPAGNKMNPVTVYKALNPADAQLVCSRLKLRAFICPYRNDSFCREIGYLCYVLVLSH